MATATRHGRASGFVARDGASLASSSTAMAGSGVMGCDLLMSFGDVSARSPATMMSVQAQDNAFREGRETQLGSADRFIVA